MYGWLKKKGKLVICLQFDEHNWKKQIQEYKYYTIVGSFTKFKLDRYLGI